MGRASKFSKTKLAPAKGKSTPDAGAPDTAPALPSPKPAPVKTRPAPAKALAKQRGLRARMSSLRRRVALASVALWVVGGLLLGLLGSAQSAIDPFHVGRSSPVSGLAFFRPSSSGSELWFLGTNDLRPRRLAENVREFDVSPSGSQLIYTMNQDEKQVRLDLLDLAAGTTRTLFADPTVIPARPRWSPADGIIAYERRAVIPNGVGAPRVWLMQPDGTTLGAAIEGGDVMGYDAVWSPSGTKLVASDTLADKMLIFNFTSTVETIPVLGKSDWSPDGKRLVISRQVLVGEEEIAELAIYDVDTKQLTPLPAGQPVQGDDSPRWSPDGTQIAFARRTKDEPLGNIWVLPMDAAGQPGVARRVTRDGREIANEDPIWSPDGRVLMWSRFVVNASGTPASTWQVDMSTPGAIPTMVIENGSYARWVP